MLTYSIRDLEKLSGIKAHTIRIWEKRYKLLKPDRTDTNIRNYTDIDVKKILNISILNKNGFKISHIARFSEEEIENNILSLLSKENAYPDIIDKMTIATVEYNEDEFLRLFNAAMIQFPFEHVILKIIYPFLQKIGFYWGINKIIPSQEHFISNIIRRKILVAIDNQKIPVSYKGVSLLFLPNKEFHELSLLMIHYFLRNAGYKVIYLGQSVPFESLVQTVKDIQPDFIFTNITTPVPNNELERYLQLLSSIKGTKKLVSGLLEQFKNIKIPASIEYIEDLNVYVSTLG